MFIPFVEYKKTFILISGMIFCLIISTFYSLGLLSVKIAFIMSVSPFLLLLFILRQELLLLVLTAAYFGTSYISSDLVIQGLVRGLFLGLIILVLLLKSGIKKSIFRIETHLDKILIFWSIVIFLAFIHGFYLEHNENRYLIGDLYKFVEIISIFWLTTFIVRNNREIKFFMWGFFIVVLIFGFVDSLVFFKRIQIVGAALEARIRGGAQFSSIFALIMAIPLIMYEKRGKVRIILGFLILCFFIAFLLCFLRTGYIALPLTLIFLLALYFYKEKGHILRSVKKIFSLLFFLLFFIGLFSLLATKISPDVNIIKATIVRFNSLINFGADSPMGVRTFEIKSIISQIVMKSPLLGKGLGGKYYSFIAFLDHWKWGITHYVHNNYFDFIARTGIIGLIIFALLAIKYLKDAISFYLRSRNNFYKGVLLGFIGIFISSCIIAFSCNAFYSPFLFTIMAMTYCVAYLEEKENGML